MSSKLEKDIEFVGKNFKKEMTKILLINAFILGISFAIYYFLKSITYALFPLAFLIVVDYLLLTSYSSLKKELEKNRLNEFIQLISYFQIYISNHINVYQCFKQLVPYSSRWMQDQLNILLEEIDTDKTVQPFVNFAHKFKASIVENVMLSIYQMVDQGESGEQLNQFSIFFGQLEKNALKAQLDAKERSLSSVESYPLVGVGMITVIIVISVLYMMGDMINVI